MPFDWTQYLSLAKDLVEVRGDEAAYRSAISRAYYAAFCVTRDLRLSHGDVDAETAKNHKAFWRSWRESGDRVRMGLGDKGNSLRMTRNNADYETRRQYIRNDALLAIADAQDIIAGLSSLDYS